MKINNIIMSFAALLLMSSCTAKFVEMNTNPDEATDEMLDWDNLRLGSAFA